MSVLTVSIYVILLCHYVIAQTQLQKLQTCLGPLATYLVTSTYTYNTANPYYSFKWLETGNRIRTIKIPLAVLMVQDITTVPTAGIIILFTASINL